MSFFFFLFFLLIHGMLSFHLKLFSHRDLQALQQPSHGLQYVMLRPTDENMGATRVLVTYMHIQILTQEQSFVNHCLGTPECSLCDV